MAVRRERVILDLEGNFESKAIRDAAAIALLKREIDGLSGRAVRAQKPLRDTERDLDNVGKAAKRNGAEVDRMSGRMRILADSLAVFGPGLVPITASVVPALAGLSNELGFAVLGAGSAVLAFHGLGDALKAMSDARLDPTKAHLEKLREEMIKLGPAGAEFARHLMAMQPTFDRLQQTARAGLFPGMTDALDMLATRTPEVARIIGVLSTTMGDLARQGATALAGPEWDSFFRSIETEAKPALADLGRATGSVAHGLAEMWQAFIPLNNDFGAGMANMAADFDRWATGLSKADGFRHFVAYLRESGPQVLDFLGSLTTMLVDIGRAAAPLGGPVLHSLTAFANAISAIATSNLGTPIFAGIAALTIYNRTLQLTRKLQAQAFGPAASGAMGRLGGNMRKVGSDLGVVYSTMATAGARTTRETERMRGAMGRLGVSALKGGAAVGGLALATSGAADSLGLTNTISLGLAGTMAGPVGAGVGLAVGAFLDLAEGGKKAGEAISSMRDQLTAATESGNAVQIASTADSIMNQIRGNPAALIAGGHADAMIKLYKAAAQAKVEVESLTGAEGLAADAAGRHGAAAQRAARSILAERNAAAETAAKFIVLGKDINNAKVSLGGWLRQMEISAAALVAFGQNAEKAARRGLADGLIKELEKAGPAGALRMRQLADGTQAEIARANRAWAMGQVAIERYQHSVAGTPRSVATTLELRAAQFESKIAQIKRELNGIPRSISTQVYVNRVNAAAQRHGKGGRDGDPSTPYSFGGFTGNYPRQQPVGVVHGGEFVFDAISTERAGVANLYAMQRSLRGYAGGGRVDGPNQTIKNLINSGATDSYGTKTTKSGSSSRKSSSSSKKKSKKRSTAWKPAAAHAFDLTGGMSAKQVDDEFWRLARTVRTHGGHLGREFAALEKKAKRLESRWDASDKALQREIKKRDDLVNQQDQLKSTVGDMLRHNPFDMGNVWMSSADRTKAGMGVFGTLQADINNAGRFSDLAKQLGSKGLHGQALAAVEGQGVDAMAMLAGMSAADIKRFQSMYDTRERAIAGAQKTAGLSLQPLINGQDRVVAEAQKTRRDLGKRIEAVEKAVEKSAGVIGDRVTRGTNNAAAGGHRKGR